MKRLSAGAGDVPAVENQLAQGHLTRHVSGQVDAPDPGHPFPGIGIAPGFDQCRELLGDPGAPAVTQPGGVPGGTLCRCWSEVLDGGGGEGMRQTADMVDEVTEGVLIAGSRCRELVVGDSFQQADHLTGRRLKVKHRSH